VRAASQIESSAAVYTAGGGGAERLPVYQKEKLGVGNKLVKELAISTFLFKMAGRNTLYGGRGGIVAEIEKGQAGGGGVGRSSNST
jgi:hypothetical protein